MYLRVSRQKNERVSVTFLLFFFHFSHSSSFDTVDYRHSWCFYTHSHPFSLSLFLSLSLSLSLSVYNLVSFALFFLFLLHISFFPFFSNLPCDVFFFSSSSFFLISYLVGVCVCRYVCVCMFTQCRLDATWNTVSLQTLYSATITIWFFCTYRRISLCSNGNNSTSEDEHTHVRTHTHRYIYIYVYIFLFLTYIFIIYTHDLGPERRALPHHFFVHFVSWTFPFLPSSEEATSSTTNYTSYVFFFFFHFFFLSFSVLHFFSFFFFYSRDRAFTHRAKSH